MVPAIVVAGVAIRIALLPTAGFAGDIDQFVTWVGHIARDGLGHAYDVDISFGPVMAFVWWFVGQFDPNLAAAANSADPAVRVVMKLPAVAADLALAGIAWSALRHRPGLVLAVMTKPQAGPLAAPFIVWFLVQAARGLGTGAILPAARQVIVLLAAGALTVLALWLPFLGANGLGNYLEGLRRYQSELYGVLSVAAWNPWWVFQEIAARGSYVQDSAPFIGGVSYRLVGYLATAAALGLITASVARRPTPRMLALGVATSALAAFELLTTMHERYAFAVLPALVLLLDDRRFRWIAGIFGVTFFLNQVSAAAGYLGGIVPLHGPVTVIGSVVNVAVLAFLLLAMWHDSRAPEPGSAINDGAAPALRRMPRGTSAGSAGATSGA